MNYGNHQRQEQVAAHEYHSKMLDHGVGYSTLDGCYVPGLTNRELPSDAVVVDCEDINSDVVG